MLLLVIYDEAADRAVALHPFRNIASHLAAGTLQSAEGRFVLKAGDSSRRRERIVFRPAPALYTVP